MIYPYQSGDVMVIGPDAFVSDDGEVIVWRGENYRREPSNNRLVDEQEL